jgi:hypothetical protein
MVPAGGPVLIWKQHSMYALVSECGEYSVAKIGSSGGRYSYESWRTKSHPSGRLLLACNLPDANTAKLCCEADRP